MADILILGEMPSQEDFKNQTKMVHGKYEFVKKILTEVIVDHDNNPYEGIFQIEYALEKPLYDDDYARVSSEDFDKAICLETLYDRINEINPRIIITLGNRLVKYFTKEKTISKAVNNVYDFDGKIIIPNYSPISVSNNPDAYMIQFVNRFEQSLGILFGEEHSLELLTEYKIISSLEEFDQLVKYCQQTGLFCFDFETTGLELYDPNIVPTVLSVSFQSGYSYIIPMFHEESEFSENDIEYIFDELGSKIFNNIDVIKIAHNLSFDLHFIKRYGINEFDGEFADTMLMHHILDENSRHGLKDLVSKYFPTYAGYDDKVDFLGPLTQLSQYAAIDTDLTLRLFILFQDQLIEDDKENRLYLLYRNLVMSSFRSLFEASHFGAKIDRSLIEESIIKAEKLLQKKLDELNSFSEVKKFVLWKQQETDEFALGQLKEKLSTASAKAKSYTKRIQNYETKIDELERGIITTYKGFNYNSPKQLGELLYSEEGFDFPKFIDPDSGKEKITTGKEYLKELGHVFTNKIFAYRTISKMISTYYKGILDRLDENDFLHTSFLQHGTVTGRLSSRNPNLQNIPTRMHFKDEDAEWCLKQVKKFFIPIDEDYVILQADYSQAELRVIANFSGDKNMQNVYINDYDIHCMTGAYIAGLSFEDFMKLDKKKLKYYRNIAKSANFGLVYGISKNGYFEYVKNSSGQKLNDKEIQLHFDAIFNTYPTLKKWHETYKAKAKKYGYVRTLFGRKRRLPDARVDSNQRLQSKAFRDAINSPIQGTSGEFAVFCCALLRHRLPKDVIFFNTVHDSIFYFVPRRKLEYVINIIDYSCANPPIEMYFNRHAGAVSMKMDFEVSSKSWGDQVEIEDMSKLEEYLCH